MGAFSSSQTESKEAGVGDHHETTSFSKIQHPGYDSTDVRMAINGTTLQISGTLRQLSRGSADSPYFSGRSGVEVLPEPLDPDYKMGEVALVLTVVNVFAGLGLLSQPFALALLGWGGIFLLAFICLVMNWTAKIIIRSMDQLGVDNFPALAEGSLGGLGRQCVELGIMLEIVGAMLTCFEFIFNQLMSLAGDSLSPLEFNRLRFISGIGAISNFSLGVVVAFVCMWFDPLEDAKTEIITSGATTSPTNFALSSGIFVFAAGAHATLPGVYNQSNVGPKRWGTLMNFCFSNIFVIYAIMASCGYYVYGDKVHVLVTQDLVKYPGGIVPKFVTALILVGSYCKISPLMVVLGETTESMAGIQENPWMQRLFRTVFFTAIAVAAYALREDVDLLEALTGAIATSMTALIVPALSYTIVQGAHLSFGGHSEFCLCSGNPGDLLTLLGLAVAVGLSIMLMFGNSIELYNRFTGVGSG